MSQPSLEPPPFDARFRHKVRCIRSSHQAAFMPRDQGSSKMTENFLTTLSPRLLSIMRIMVGLLFLEHGTSKYFGLPITERTGVDPWSLSGANGMIELVGGVL